MRKTFLLPVGAVPAAPPTVDNIEHSVRFNSADSAYMSRTPSSAGNRKTWTWSGWVKRSGFGRGNLFNAYNGALTPAGYINLQFSTADALVFQTAYTVYRTTTQVFRDPSAWYHLVLAVDTTQATANDRVKIYVNGEQVTDFSTTNNPSQDADLAVNGAFNHRLGSEVNQFYLDGYLANIELIDGQALTPTSFGFTDSNGVWQPKAYTGDYGTEDYPGATTDSSGSFFSGRGPENLFDGSLTTLCDPAQADGTITFTPTTGIPYSSSVEVYTASDYPTGNYTQVSVNGGTAVSVTTSDVWFTVASGSGTLNSLSLRLPGFRPNFKAIRVDGKILVNSPNGFHLDFADTSSATALGNDVSGNNNDWTPSGLVAGPAYTANSFSTEFDGTGDYLTTPSNTDVGFGTGDFTVEAWIYSNGNQSTYATIISLSDGSGGNDWQFEASVNKISLRNLLTPTATYTHNAWHHVAWTRQGSSNYLFLDGVQIGTFTDSTDWDYGSFNVGSNRGFNYFFNGKISNLRVIKGQALYTAAFTPPSTALTAVTNTVLLTCQDSTFIDNSASAHTITANGDAATSTVSPFEPVDGSDAMLDSPTNYGSGDLVRGNYATLNPLISTSSTLSNGNLDYASTATYQSAYSTIGMRSGKWYFEGTVNTFATNAMIGVGYAPFDTGTYVGGDIRSWGYDGSGARILNNGVGSFYGASYGAGDVISVAFDADTGKLWFAKNGTWQASGNPVTGVNPGVTLTTGLDYMFGVSAGNTGTWSCNFGQQPFKYPAPAGYKSLCSTNLPTPAVADGSTAMDATIYTGDGGIKTISGLNHSPDLVWIKSRDTTGYSHVLQDTVRGVDKTLFSNSNASESTNNYMDGFTSDGFRVDGNSYNITNELNKSYVGWAWDAGSSTVSNTDGTITSQVRANPTAGVSVVTWTSASSSTTNSFGHGLAKTPEFIVMKSRNNIGNNNNWLTYHSALGATKYLRLNTTDAATTTNIWVSGPSSSVVNIEAGAWQPGDWITYAFAPVEGFSAFGSYTGNGSTDGPFIYTGFRPKWIMTKASSGGGSVSDWLIFDSVRDSYNVGDKNLSANGDTQEQYYSANILRPTDIDILSNGFKLRNVRDTSNRSGDPFIFAAFAEHPFKTSRAR